MEIDRFIKLIRLFHFFLVEKKKKGNLNRIEIKRNYTWCNKFHSNGINGFSNFSKTNLTLKSVLGRALSSNLLNTRGTWKPREGISFFFLTRSPGKPICDTKRRKESRGLSVLIKESRRNTETKTFNLEVLINQIFRDNLLITRSSRRARSSFGRSNNFVVRFESFLSLANFIEQWTHVYVRAHAIRRVGRCFIENASNCHVERNYNEFRYNLPSRPAFIPGVIH